MFAFAKYFANSSSNLDGAFTDYIDNLVKCITSTAIKKTLF